MKNPTEKVQLSVLHADREAAALISSPSEAVRKQAEEMYGLKLGEAGGPGSGAVIRSAGIFRDTARSQKKDRTEYAIHAKTFRQAG
ncbi:hypothetical protein NXX50_02905 [Bacteroides fragilis]|nr:hypothetical protein [Bacteroides fragilis]